MKKVKVFLKQRNNKLDKPYSYRAGNDSEVGMRVLVPFGRGNRIIEGIITEISDEDDDSLKEIIGKIDETALISKEQIELNQFLKENTFKTFYSSLSEFTEPIKTTKNSKGEIKAYRPKPDYVITLKKYEKVRGKVQQEILNHLTENGIKLSELKRSVPKVTLKTLERLQELDLIGIKKMEISDTLPVKSGRKTRKDVYILDNLDEFCRLLIKEREKGGQSLILFPNNFLARRFNKYLNSQGIDSVYYPPDLTLLEKYQFYQEVRSGQIPIVVSTHPGLFLNYNDLSSIFVTYLGDSFYLPDQYKKFNVLELAEKEAEITGAHLILTDFMKSLKLLENTESKNWTLVSEKIHNPLVTFDYIDLGDENTPVFSKSLQEALVKNFNDKKKTLLVVNRKGYFNYYTCSKCHKPLVCPRCGSILRGLKSDTEVECRMCDFHARFPDECSFCGNREFQKFQFGIERILEKVQELLPQANIVPYFKNYPGDTESADVIVATSQILFLPKIENVATVGAVLVDIDYNYPDFHSPETALRFYREIFSRYRGAEIIVQTQYYEDSFLDALQGKGDFFSEQAAYRSLAQVPPFSDLYIFTLTAKNSSQVKQAVETLKERLRENCPELKILKTHIARRIKGVSQRRFFVKDLSRGKLRNVLNEMLHNGELSDLDARIMIELNPSSTI